MTEIEAFQKIVDWFESRGQSKIDATRQANYSASRTHEIEDSELRVLTKSYHERTPRTAHERRRSESL